MIPRIASTDEIVDLMFDLAEDRISPQQVDRLDELLCADLANCQNYVDFMAIVTRLSWIGDDGTDGAIRMSNGQSPEVPAQWVVDRGHEIPASQSSRPALGIEPSSAIPAPFPTFLSTTLHGTVGYFSSGWPVAYLVATVIFGIGLLIGSLMHVSQPVQVARQSSSPSRVDRRAEDGICRPDHRHGRLPMGRYGSTSPSMVLRPFGPQVRAGSGSDGNHLRHGGEGHFAGAGDV